MFGFSRGAFTARFLARMIANVGLLSKGNEEMVPFAYRTYQEYEMGSGSKFKNVEDAKEYMKNFKTTFCRARTKIHFLGLFDTVNSVGYFENPFERKKYLPSVVGTASHVRHAVAIDERRCKFKPALLQQDKRLANSPEEDIKEVFFPGGHGDVGGGWPAKGGKAKVEADDALQLSDLALEWMISELDALHPADKVSWNEHRDIFLRNFNSNVSAAVQAPLHDILAYGNCVSRTQTFLWRIMGTYGFFSSLWFGGTIITDRLCPEWLPIFTRLELIHGQWKPITFPPNMCRTRDIPEGASFHPSVKARMLTVKDYRPTNEGILKIQTV